MPQIIDVLHDRSLQKQLLHQFAGLFDLAFDEFGIGEKRLHQPVGNQARGAHAVGRFQGPVALGVESLVVAHIGHVARARLTRGPDRGIQLLKPLVESRHAQDAARHEGRAALDTAFAAVCRRENFGISLVHALGDAPVFGDAARRKVAVTFVGVGRDDLDAAQHITTQRRQRTGFGGFAQDFQRPGIDAFGGVPAAAVAAVMADVERRVPVGRRSRRSGPVFV